MAAVRRLYIYLISAISLQAVTWALVAMLRNLSIRSLEPPTTTIAFEIAVVIIGLPIYLVHWLWGQRLVQREPGELEAGLRRFYLYATLAGFLGPILASAYYLIVTLSGGTSFYLGNLYLARNERVLFHIIPALVLGVLWWYHRKLLDAELRYAPDRTLSTLPSSTLSGTSESIPESAQDYSLSSAADSESNASIERLYRFGFCAAGLFLTCFGSIHILRNILYLTQNEVNAITSGAYSPWGNALARLVVGAATWLVFWTNSQRLFADPASEERQSTLRKFYLYAAVFTGVVGAVGYGATILAGVFRRLLALPAQGDLRIAIPIMLVMAVVWAYHASILRQDQRLAVEAPQQAAIRRIYLYLVAGVGLAAVLIGVGGVISVFLRAIDQVLGSDLRNQLAWFSAATLAGLPVWLLHWRQAQQAALANQAEAENERTSLVRKIYLYFYIFAATMTVLSGLVYIVYRLFSMFLGEAAPKISELGQALAFCIIAVGVWLYHGACLRSDGRLTQTSRSEHLRSLWVVIVDAGEAKFGQKLQEALKQAYPGLAPALLHPEQKDQANAAEILAKADLIILPWSNLLRNDDWETQTWVEAARLSPAKKLLLPAPVEGWEISGMEPQEPAVVIRQTVHAVGQVIAGEAVKPKKPLSPAAVLGLVVAGLFGFSLLMSAISWIVQSFNR